MFSRFKEDYLDISDTRGWGSSSGFDETRLNTLIHNDPRKCTPELSNMMNCDHSTIVWYLHSMEKVQKSSVWVPHARCQNHKNQRVAIVYELIIDWLVNNINHLYPVSLLVTRNGVFMLTKGIDRKGWARTREECLKCSNFSIWHSIFWRPRLHSLSSNFKLQYVSSSTTIELQIKNDNR